jgi:hypothetical protein
MTTTFLVNIEPNGTYSVHAIIDNGNGSFTSMSKDAYFAQLGTEPTQAELDAIAKAQADAEAQATAEATAQATFEANLAATNAKLEALGLTAQDISVLLNAAKQ